MNEELVNLLGDELKHSLEKASSLGAGEDTRKKEIENAVKLGEILNAVDQTRNKAEDDQARQTLEQHRIQTTNEVELQKCKRRVGDYVLEVCKIVVPVLITCVAYDKFQDKVLSFEENGRIVSTAGRELHLPNLFKR